MMSFFEKRNGYLPVNIIPINCFLKGQSTRNESGFCSSTKDETITFYGLWQHIGIPEGTVSYKKTSMFLFLTDPLNCSNVNLLLVTNYCAPCCFTRFLQIYLETLMAINGLCLDSCSIMVANRPKTQDTALLSCSYCTTNFLYCF